MPTCIALVLSHTVDYPYKTGQEQVPQSCPQYKEAHGHSISPKEPVWQKKLWGSTEDVVQTTNFINTVKLDV